MSLKYRVIIILVVLAAAAALLFLPQKASPDEAIEEGTPAEEVLLADKSDPFKYFMQAREAKKPIVLEFYAHW